MTSTVYFFIYGVLTRNNPQVYPQVTLPALVSGVMWSFGTNTLAHRCARLPIHQAHSLITLVCTVNPLLRAAQLCFFLATPGLGMVITMPITTVGPGVIASLWSVFVFHEIQGRHNYITLVVAISVSLCAMAMLVLSF
jgi:glucose uptake protein GlcU